MPDSHRGAVPISSLLPPAKLKLEVQLLERTFTGGLPGELRWRLWLKVSIYLAYFFWYFFQRLFVIVFCILGTEEEMGGDGAGEVSTFGGERERGAQETSSSYRTAHIDRWGPHYCLPASNLSQSRSCESLEKAFDEGILTSKWVSF